MILNLLYSKSDNLDIIEKVNPDFQLKHKNAKSYFGVEVTVLFFSDSMARIRKTPNNFNDLLLEDEHRHKDNIDVLKSDLYSF